MQAREDSNEEGFEQPEYNKVSTEFKESVVNVLGSASLAAPGSWAHFMGRARTTMGEVLQSKAQDVNKVLKKRGWKSAMNRIDNFLTPEIVAEYTFDAESAGYATDEGAAFWVVGHKANVFRYGPENIPMPGMPMLLMPIDCAFVVTCFRIDSLVSQGILISDLPGFLQSPSASEFLKESSIVVMVGKGEVIHIPMGFVASVSYSVLSREQEIQQPFGTYLAYTMWFPNDAAALQPQIWAAIQSFNQKYHDTVATQRPFVSRVSLFSRFAKKVGDLATS